MIPIGKNCVLLNSVQEIIVTEAWLLLTFFLCSRNQLLSIHFIVAIKPFHDGGRYHIEFQFSIQIKLQFSQKRKSYSKNWSIVLKLKVLRLKRQQFRTNLLCQKPLLIQIEW